MYANVECAATFLTDAVYKASPAEAKQIEKFMLKHLNTLEASIKRGNKLHLSEFEIFLISLLVHRMNELTLLKQSKRPDFWYSREGRSSL